MEDERRRPTSLPSQLAPAPEDALASAGTGDILIGTDRAAARVTLNRPQALNALTTPMAATCGR